MNKFFKFLGYAILGLSLFYVVLALLDVDTESSQTVNDDVVVEESVEEINDENTVDNSENEKTDVVETKEESSDESGKTKKEVAEKENTKTKQDKNKLEANDSDNKKVSNDINEIEIDGKKIKEHSKTITEYANSQSINSLLNDEDFNLEKSYQIYLNEVFTDYLKSANNLTDLLNDYVDADSKERKAIQDDINDVQAEVYVHSSFVANSYLIAPQDSDVPIEVLDDFNDNMFETMLNVIPILYDDTDSINVDIDEEYFVEEFGNNLMNTLDEFDEAYQYMIEP